MSVWWYDFCDEVLYCCEHPASRPKLLVTACPSARKVSVGFCPTNTVLAYRKVFNKNLDLDRKKNRSIFSGTSNLCNLHLSILEDFSILDYK